MKLEVIGLLIGAAILIAFGIWMQWFAPCSWHAGGTLRTVPVRCVELKK